MGILKAFRQVFSSLGNLFAGIFFKKPIEPTPEPVPAPVPPPPPSPVPPPPPTPAPIPPPPPVPNPFTQTQWWHGSYRLTQAYGCSDFAGEGHNPHHPECAYFHEGEDYGLPMRTPIYAGYEIYVVQLDVPGYLGGNALHLCVGPGPTCDHDIWLYHMDEVVVKAGTVYPKGTLIGYSGAKGFVTGPHIHFEVRPHNGAYRSSIPPNPWLIGTAYEG